jgi:hypothetical protein
MLKLSLVKVLFASAALFAVFSAAPVVPAHAQGVPAGLLRLDSAQQENIQLTEQQRTKLRSSYAHVRKQQAN